MSSLASGEDGLYDTWDPSFLDSFTKELLMPSLSDSNITKSFLIFIKGKMLQDSKVRHISACDVADFMATCYYAQVFKSGMDRSFGAIVFCGKLDQIMDSNSPSYSILLNATANRDIYRNDKFFVYAGYNSPGSPSPDGRDASFSPPNNVSTGKILNTRATWVYEVSTSAQSKFKHLFSIHLSYGFHNQVDLKEIFQGNEQVEYFYVTLVSTYDCLALGIQALSFAYDMSSGYSGGAHNDFAKAGVPHEQFPVNTLTPLQLCAFRGSTVGCTNIISAELYNEHFEDSFGAVSCAMFSKNERTFILCLTYHLWRMNIVTRVVLLEILQVASQDLDVMLQCLPSGVEAAKHLTVFKKLFCEPYLQHTQVAFTQLEYAAAARDNLNELRAKEELTMLQFFTNDQMYVPQSSLQYPWPLPQSQSPQVPSTSTLATKSSQLPHSNILAPQQTVSLEAIHALSQTTNILSTANWTHYKLDVEAQSQPISYETCHKQNVRPSIRNTKQVLIHPVQATPPSQPTAVVSRAEILQIEGPPTKRARVAPSRLQLKTDVAPKILLKFRHKHHWKAQRLEYPQLEQELQHRQLLLDLKQEQAEKELIAQRRQAERLRQEELRQAQLRALEEQKQEAIRQAKLAEEARLQLAIVLAKQEAEQKQREQQQALHALEEAQAQVSLDLTSANVTEQFQESRKPWALRRQRATVRSEAKNDQNTRAQKVKPKKEESDDEYVDKDDTSGSDDDEEYEEDEVPLRRRKLKHPKRGKIQKRTKELSDVEIDDEDAEYPLQGEDTCDCKVCKMGIPQRDLTWADIVILTLHCLYLAQGKPNFTLQEIFHFIERHYSSMVRTNIHKNSWKKRVQEAVKQGDLFVHIKVDKSCGFEDSYSPVIDKDPWCGVDQQIPSDGESEEESDASSAEAEVESDMVNMLAVLDNHIQEKRGLVRFMTEVVTRKDVELATIEKSLLDIVNSLANPQMGKDITKTIDGIVGDLVEDFRTYKAELRSHFAH